MCGIVGETSFGNVPANHLWVRQASDNMAHRGPDGDGFYSEEHVSLGHRRLAIIDLTGGVQPMSYANRRYWITFNGEIYNYRSLKAELRAAGSQFDTDSDTEVILAAYAEWGTASFARLDGIFAFAIWDQ